jgi:uncharacterized protein (DUF2147 family)
MFRPIKVCVYIFSVVLLCGALEAASVRAANLDSVLGNWSTEDGHGVIAIEQCGDSLCGRIVGIVRAPGEPIPKGVNGISQCGLTVITKEKPMGDGSWLGEVTDPRTGTMYRAKLWVDDMGNLRLRGFLGSPLLGQTQTWNHFTGRLTDACRLR